jgi:hypothetical protein
MSFQQAHDQLPWIGDAMIESERHEVQLSQAARRVARSACEMAKAARLTLTRLHWHRGHEVADLDHHWLTLESQKHAMTEHFPNEWLEALGKSDDDPRIAQRLSAMVQALTASQNRL